MSTKKVIKEDSIRGENERLHPKGVLREILRNYLEFRDIVTSPERQVTGLAGGNRAVGDARIGSDGVIDYIYSIATPDGIEKVELSVSFWDLQGILKRLSPRKREAVFYNVILDKKQKDVAAIMNITTVSVGQYVVQGMVQLSEGFFDAVEVKSEYDPFSNGILAAEIG